MINSTILQLHSSKNTDVFQFIHVFISIHNFEYIVISGVCSIILFKIEGKLYKANIKNLASYFYLVTPQYIFNVCTQYIQIAIIDMFY